MSTSVRQSWGFFLGNRGEKSIKVKVIIMQNVMGGAINKGLPRRWGDWEMLNVVRSREGPLCMVWDTKATKGSHNYVSVALTKGQWPQWLLRECPRAQCPWLAMISWQFLCVGVSTPRHLLPFHLQKGKGESDIGMFKKGRWAHQTP